MSVADGVQPDQLRKLPTRKTLWKMILGAVAAAIVGFIYTSVYNNGLPHIGLPGQRMSADDLAQKSESILKSSIQDKIGKDVTISGYSLVHKNGNEYSGYASVSTATDGATQVSVDVVVDEDGKYLVKWETMP